MKLYPLAYTAALLPLLAIHLCYLLAAAHGHVDWCIPYIDSCASISRSGRLAPEFFVFKGLMIPAAVVLFGYWLACERWLAGLAGRPGQRMRSLLLLAAVACAGLVLYSVMLGAIGGGYQTLRRVGVSTFFGLSYIAQMLVTARLFSLTRNQPRLRRLTSILYVLSVAILLLGLASVILDAVVPDYYDSKVNAFEWCVTLLLCLHVLVTGRFWQHTGFASHFTVGR